MEITIHSGQHHSCSNIENQCSSPLIHKYIFEHQAENLPSKCVFHWFFQPTSLLGFHLGELKALTSCSGKSAPVGSCLHSQWWSGAGPFWLCTWKILDGGFLHSSFWPWPSGSRYAALRSMQCLVGRREVERKKGDHNEDGIIKCKYGKQSIWIQFSFIFL